MFEEKIQKANLLFKHLLGAFCRLACRKPGRTPDHQTRTLSSGIPKKRKDGFRETRADPARISCTPSGSVADSRRISRRIRSFLTKTIRTLLFSEFASGGLVDEHRAGKLLFSFAKRLVFKRRWSERGSQDISNDTKLASLNSRGLIAKRKENYKNQNKGKKWRNESPAPKRRVTIVPTKKTPLPVSSVSKHVTYAQLIQRLSKALYTIFHFFYDFLFNCSLQGSHSTLFPNGGVLCAEVSCRISDARLVSASLSRV